MTAPPRDQDGSIGLEAMREALHRRPFKPFVVCLADGHRFPIASADSVAVGKQRAFVIGPDDSCASIEPALITSLDDIAEHAPRSIQRIRQLYDATPFRPFIIHLADGCRIAVKRREFMALSPSGRTMVVYQADDTFNPVDLLLMTDLEIRNGKRSKGRHS